MHEKVADQVEDRIIMLYKRFKSYRQVAREVGISHTAVRDICVRRGVPKAAQHRKYMPTRYSKVAKWLAANPDANLPRDFRVMGVMMGMKESVVRQHYYRLLKYHEEEVGNALKGLLTHYKAASLASVEGVHHIMGTLSDYRIEIDKFDFSCTITAKDVNDVEVSFMVEPAEFVRRASTRISIES